MQTRAAGFSALRFRDFRLFWVGQIVSFSGTWMHSTAQGWLVYSLTHSPHDLGLVYAASSLPILMFGLFGGAMADRFGKRGLLMLTQGISIIPALIIGALTTFGAVEVWHVISLGFLLGTVNALDIPTRQAFFINMVDKPSLMNAIALNSAAFNGARIIGPTLAGFVISAVGVAACFYLNAASFLAVLLSLYMIKAEGPAIAKIRDEGILAEIKEGMRFVAHEKEILKTVLIVAALSFFGLPFISQLPVFAVDVLDVGPKGLGFLSGAAGVGAFLSAVFIASRGEVQDKKRFMAITSISFPALLVIFALSKSYALSLITIALAGMAVVGFLATANSMIQLRSPDGIRGRVMSVYTLVFLGMTPVGHYLMGAMAEEIGAVKAVVVFASCALLISVIINLTARPER